MDRGAGEAARTSKRRDPLPAHRSPGRYGPGDREVVGRQEGRGPRGPRRRPLALGSARPYRAAARGGPTQGGELMLTDEPHAYPTGATRPGDVELAVFLPAGVYVRYCREFVLPQELREFHEAPQEVRQ